eukprot:8696645-Alexandrium_andersonii.AAC.1
MPVVVRRKGLDSFSAHLDRPTLRDAGPPSKRASAASREIKSLTRSSRADEPMRPLSDALSRRGIQEFPKLALGSKHELL